MSHGSLQHVSSRLVGVVTVPEYGCISLNNEQKILPVCKIMPWQELICHFTALKVPVYGLVELCTTLFLLFCMMTKHDHVCQSNSYSTQ